MKNNYFILCYLLGALALQAQVGTSFVEPIGSGTTLYTDPSTADHFLVNNGGGQPPVTHASSGGEIGFTTFFFGAHSPTTGLTDGDAVGVYNSAAAVVGGATYTDSYVMEDPDGTLRFETDLIDLTGTTSPRFQMRLFLNSTGWEIGANATLHDRLYVALEIDNGASPDFVIIDTDGGGVNGGGFADLDNYIYPGTGATLEEMDTAIDVDISTYIGQTVNLVVIFNSNSGAEDLAFDDILFTEGSNATLSTGDTQLVNTAITMTPNPSNGKVTLSNTGIALQRVQFFDVNGRVMANYPLNDLTTDQEFDLSGTLTTGMYFVRITSDEGTAVKKLIVR